MTGGPCESKIPLGLMDELIEFYQIKRCGNVEFQLHRISAIFWSSLTINPDSEQRGVSGMAAPCGMQ